MRILAVDPLRPGLEHGSHKWGTTCVRERFEEGRIYTTADSGYLHEPWLMVPVQGRPHSDTAEGKYNSAYVLMCSIVERNTRLHKSRFHCFQQFRTLLQLTVTFF